MSNRILSIAILVAALALPALPSHAGSRYATPPPITLSPDLTSPWLLQLGPGRRATTAAPVVRQKQLRRSYKLNRAPQRVVIRQKSRQLKRQKTKLRRATNVQRTAALASSTRKAPRKRGGYDPALLPTLVDYPTKQRPGTIIINTGERRLYRILPNGKARRYGVGVGRQGFQWKGTNKISRKAEWPSWTPPKVMRAREAKKGRILPVTMKGGPSNPLGARAMYLGSTIYRIHGSNQPWSIGKAVSSGCIRMRNEDVMQLYERVKVGDKVIVL